MQKLCRAGAAIGAAALLAGCSVLSGTTSTTKTLSYVPHSSAPALDPASRAAFSRPRVVTALLAAARHDVETIYTYDYRDLTKYENAGLAVTTIPYADEYRAIFDGKARDKLRAGQFVQVATATSAGLASLTGTTHAKVIVQASLQIVSAASPDGASKSTAVVVTLARKHGTWLVSNVADGAAAQGPIPANAALRSAMTVTRATVELLYALHRRGFGAQFAKLVGQTAGAMHDTLVSHEAALRKTLGAGKYDLSSRIVGFAVVRAGTEPTFTVAVEEYHDARQHTRLGPYRHVFTVTAKRINGHWLLTSAVPVS